MKQRHDDAHPKDDEEGKSTKAPKADMLKSHYKSMVGGKSIIRGGLGAGTSGKDATSGLYGEKHDLFGKARIKDGQAALL